MRCEIIAIGTELLLGQLVDTNSAWIGDQLALGGIECHFQTRVGDNHARMVSVLRAALDRADAVLCCGGLGPTHDDVTREAIAEVMGVDLVADEAIAERIRERFAARGRTMSENNLRQAMVPRGASTMAQQPGTAPGLVCPVGDQVIYAVPGVPYEMKEMVSGTVLADLRRRGGLTSTIRSRTLRTWGQSESGLAEILDERITALDGAGNPTLAFNASGIEGIKVRITARADDEDAANAMLDAEEAALRSILGDLVFGLDGTTMEAAVLAACRDHGLRLAVAESVTGGLMASRLTTVPGASDTFVGGVVTYLPEIKRQLLGVADGPVVTEDAAASMAAGVCRLLGADAAVAVTGVAGPEPAEGLEPGTVCVGVRVGDDTDTATLRFPGDRVRVQQFATISALDLLRRRLAARPA
ncbi:MAG: competence/damage-inducible protein A [Actinomycetota bacterium]|nr:competence/damage-inducible protein A [Actinomycetota bacterium]